MTLIAAVSLLIVCAIVGLLLWSAHAVDRISRQHDAAIVALVLDKVERRTAHIQEAATISDESVAKVAQRPLDLDWLDHKLGTWFHGFAAIDEIYLLNPRDEPIYAMRDGRRVAPDAFAAVAATIRPFVARLRRMGPMLPTGQAKDDLTPLSPGVADLAMIRGRPAIVSAKPIIPETAGKAPGPREAAVHVSVIYLDEAVIGAISRRYGLADARYSRQRASHWGEASLPLVGQDGHGIGYVLWRPFAPGWQVTGDVGPVLLIGLLLSVAVIYVLARRLARKTLDLEESRVQAQHLALHDGLTGLPNRALFESRLDDALARCRRDRTLVALLYIDLDRFKQVNDSLGHPAGDLLIREVARRLTTEVRGYDMVARLGGDEFGILIVAPEDREAVERICARVVAELACPFDLAGAQSFIGASIGVAMAPTDGLGQTDLARKADIALYKAKMHGRSRYVFFEPWMDEVVRIRETTHRELRLAITDCDNQLKVLYQPVFSTITGAVTGVEALLRWDHPVNGIISPDEFIGSAEESGLIEVLGAWVLRKAMHDAADWPGLRIAVNVSPVQMRSRAFADSIVALMAETGIAPGRLELEITETVLMGDFADVADALARLRGIGVTVALDDFGTGYSSLSHIRDIAVDRIKIDQSFVNAIDAGQGMALVEAVVALAKANGLQITAEGVETERELEFLTSLGCHEVQGYLLGRPIGAAGITAILGHAARDGAASTAISYRAA
ncbi:putative bifunctional diguanylate cyclase/phosphodiesterase [Novosphingobium album (ex Liu et al. 2023)]|uniref:EAL domain-containing protein n=1 Tax=Novosphingobium album (ex Liu et al. 2023) TaxID=3031130 RepID=A0ABT5WQL6_9SPHN|nr:EAL domain-containing protein [Novosphingobium album (ex Liu et al. 2023)]MDE8652329.1 EAL domain-containing protein [Novosphingobium album (ex Liu et al. 2023)]